jgi:thiol-disulfide isomerase/thioredoxin
MNKQWVPVVAVLAALVMAGFALVWFGPEQTVAVGAKAPNYKVLDLKTGDSVALRGQYRGHVTLVNIWATWCAPCKEEMPSMQRLYDSLAARGFKIAAVSIDMQGPAIVRAFADDLKLSFDILHDRSGNIQQAYQTTGVPESFLLDDRGIIMKRVIGAHEWDSPVNRGLVRRLLGDTATMADSASLATDQFDSLPAASR